MYYNSWRDIFDKYFDEEDFVMLNYNEKVDLKKRLSKIHSYEFDNCFSLSQLIKSLQELSEIFGGDIQVKPNNLQVKLYEDVSNENIINKFKKIISEKDKNAMRELNKYIMDICEKEVLLDLE